MRRCGRDARTTAGRNAGGKAGRNAGGKAGGNAGGKAGRRLCVAVWVPCEELTSCDGAGGTPAPRPCGRRLPHGRERRRHHGRERGA